MERNERYFHSLIGISFGLTGFIAWRVANYAWLYHNRANLWLASFYAKFLELFTTDLITESQAHSPGFSLSEELAIELTYGLALLLGSTAILWGLSGFKRGETFSLAMTSLFLGNAIFILTDLRLALMTWSISFVIAIYIKRQRAIKR